MKNRYHIEVNKWCASCRFKDVDNEGNRICTLMQLKVPQTFHCQRWRMNDSVANAGKP